MPNSILTVCLVVSSLIIGIPRHDGHAAKIAAVQELSGRWQGVFETDAFALSMDLILTREGDGWSAKIKFKEGKREETPAVRNLLIQDNHISFALTLSGMEIKFTGNRSGDELGGTAEGYRDNLKIGTGKWELKRFATHGSNSNVKTDLSILLASSNKFRNF